MLHRIRLAHQGKHDGKLSGEVEVDETFLGGKARNMHASKRAEKIKGHEPEGKTIVAAALQRGGKMRAEVVSSRRRPELQELVRDAGRCFEASVFETVHHDLLSHGARAKRGARLRSCYSLAKMRRASTIVIASEPGE
jgi:hypothetical protein